MIKLGLWNAKKIQKQAQKDFEKTWLDTKDLVLKGGRKGEKRDYRDYKKSKTAGTAGTGVAHIIPDTVSRLRDAYLDMGFSEVINPIFIEDKQVKKQFGPEAVAVLDRCYYLGGLPRPDVGLGDDRIKEIEGMGVKVDKANRDGLQDVLHRYKKGVFGGDDLIYKIGEVLDVDTSLAVKILDTVFPEFKRLEPSATKMTLRSHMTSGWFLTLAELINKKPLPIRLFSIDRCFRREQSEDETHLRTHYSASCVVAAEDASVEEGKAVAEGLLSRFGFERFKFLPDEKKSKYYTPDTQTEVYAYHNDLGFVEVATFGVYSPVALSRYKIEYPVMNLGLGVERLSMVLYGFKDVREMVYPQFYGKWILTDEELSRMVNIDKVPASDKGKAIAGMIVRIGERYKDEPSPCEFQVYSGAVLGKKVCIKLIEREEKTRLLGPAAFNEIFVYNNNIYGIPPAGSGDIRKGGVPCSIRYIDGIANLAAYKIEKAIEADKPLVRIRVPIVRNVADINVKLDDAARRYITTYSKKIDVRGPVFITVEARIGSEEDE